MGETFYDVLGVDVDASQDEIEAAYRERVKETHPDLNDAPDASDAFQRVQAAEEVLGDPDERARYDRLGHGSYTSHFGAGAGDGGGRWDVGTDPTADADAHADASGSRWGTGVRDDGSDGRGGAGGASDDGVGADGGFGFDPGAYDRTRRGDGSNPSERSYDVGGSSGDAGSASASASGASANATDGASGGASAASATGAGGATVGDPTDDRHWRERERSKHAQREGRGTVDDATDGGYSVRDWDDEELDTARTPYRLQGSEVVVVGIMFVLYPFMAYSAITPQFSLVVNVTVAACALLLTGYLLTMPRIAIYVFGAWSVIAPVALLLFPALDPVSLLGVVVLGSTWIPFGYSVLFMQVLR
ncbi:J domain-containing protein [Halorubellus salinus]|uniref:J domain-containing protein n=1 Tax=Halorubellus salinus TaxID=755309 RepID=UPI001D0932D9|nr:J domain-containing protein [Halorubellus salinus]